MEGEVVHVSLKVENGRNKVTVVNLVHNTKERGASTAERRLTFFGVFFLLVVKVGIPAEMTGDRKLGDLEGKM